jgi:heme/copper-type cytochrome/quinol oxidase subunit 1
MCWLKSTDHKQIGMLYIIFSLVAGIVRSGVFGY